MTIARIGLVGGIAAGLIAGASIGGAVAQPVVPLDESAVLETIVFGSCARSDRDQPIWESIVTQRPDLFLFIGDNVYHDVPDVPTSAHDMWVKYEELGAKPEYRALAETCPILATWDDHDYGLNDAGREWELKQASQALMLTFFGEPAGSPRWAREGVYDAKVIGPRGKRVQVILLDTRFHRDPLDKNPRGREGGLGPYLPTSTGTMLGAEQWTWLEEQLREQADVRIIASSIQVVAHEHRWECWGNMPRERERLYGLIDETDASGVVFISGDRHLIEISKDEEPGTPYPMWDFTSSGFNWGDGEVDEPNRYRVGPVQRMPNFGVIRIDWDSGVITLEGRDGNGDVLMRSDVELSTLRAETR